MIFIANAAFLTCAIIAPSMAVNYLYFKPSHANDSNENLSECERIQTSMFEQPCQVLEGVHLHSKALKVLKGHFCHVNFLTLFWGQEEMFGNFFLFQWKEYSLN